MDEQVFDTQEESSRRNSWYGLLFAVVVLIVVWLLWNYWGSAQRTVDSDGDTVAASVVPDVVGKREADAVAGLQRAGFKADVRLSAQTGRPPGSVVSQNPAGGTEAEPGLTVRIDVIPAAATPGEAFDLADPETVVPDVVGRSRALAANTLDSTGYVMSVTEVYSDEFPPGKVMAQRPAAGTALAEGSTVAVTVSLGSRAPRQVEVPQTLGLTEAQAISRLRTAGFVAKPTYQPRTDRLGIVYDQAPYAGERIDEGSDVIILVGVRP